MTSIRPTVPSGGSVPYILRDEQTVPGPVEKVFAFFARPENLGLITPASLGFRMLTPAPVEMRKGALIDYSIRILGVRVRWRTLISEFVPLSSFTDEQLIGPYAFWRHTHTFIPVGEETLVRDEVRYLLPFGNAGRMAHPLLVRPKLEEIFRYRRSVIASLFANPHAKPALVERGN
ncbi:MAG TPA: SRPBCC family protein [Bacteroidota bacterium]|nr:SRPBCC family protein [Bacteroidota bacterium]